MYKFSFLLGATLLAFGCPGEKDDTADDTSDTDTDTDTDTDADPTFDASWSTSGLTLTITDGSSSGDYYLGMVESDPASTDPWTGEDCLDGYTTGSGTVYNFCHPMSSTGVALSHVGSVGEIVEGSTTIFSNTLESVITYGVWDTAADKCWTWGKDTSYYTVEGCTAM